jgi:Peptidase M50B-like
MSPRRTLLAAVAVVWLLEHVIPFGSLILYPFTLWTTWVHEMGHGVAGLLLGGRFEHLVIYWDGSGYAQTSAPGWRDALVCAAGMLAPPFVGAVLLILSRGARRSFLALLALSFAMILSVLVWVRSPAGLVAVPLTAAATALFARRGSPAERVWLTQLLAITLALDTLWRMIPYALSSTAEVGGSESRSDVAGIADVLGGPQFFWGLLIIAVALAFLAVGLWAAWKPSSIQKKSDSL